MSNIQFVQQTRQDIQDAGFTDADLSGDVGLNQRQKNLLGLGQEVKVEQITINSWEDMKKVVNKIIEHGAGEYDVRFGAKIQQDVKQEILGAMRDFRKSGDLEELRTLIADKCGVDGIKDLGDKAQLEVNVSRLEIKAFGNFDLTPDEIIQRVNSAGQAERRHVLVVKEDDEDKAVTTIVDALAMMERSGQTPDAAENFVLVVRKGEARARANSYEGIQFTPEQLKERLLGNPDDRRAALEALAGIADRKTEAARLEIQDQIDREREAAEADAQRRTQELQTSLDETRGEIEREIREAAAAGAQRIAELETQRDQQLQSAGASFRDFATRTIPEELIADVYQPKTELEDHSDGFHLSIG